LHIDLGGIWTSAIDVLAGIWTYAKDFLNSNFFIAIAGSFAGAFAGAYGAQWIVERGKERDEILTEMRNTNAATVVSFAICNTFVTMKQQQIKPLKERFDTQKRNLLEHIEKARLGQIPSGTPFQFLADFQTIFSSPIAIDILRQLLFERISLDERRPLMLVTALSDSIHGFTSTLDNHNKLIASYKATQFLEGELLHLYFGLPQGSRGITNKEYPDLIEQIYRHTDDGIFFSKMICDDLFEHNVRLAQKFKQRFGKSAPGIIEKPDFTKAKSSGLMPNDADYKDWFNLYEKRERPSGTRRKSISSRFVSFLRRG
jgi:hypothetical protein